MSGPNHDPLAELEAHMDELPQEALDSFVQRNRRHRYAIHLPGTHAISDPLGAASCRRSLQLVLTGTDRTSAAGTRSFNLRKLFCSIVAAERDGWQYPERQVQFIGAPQFVATALRSSPALITAVARTRQTTMPPPFVGTVDGDGTDATARILDVTIEVSSWELSGAKAGSVAFSWLAHVEIALGLYGNG